MQTHSRSLKPSNGLRLIFNFLMFTLLAGACAGCWFGSKSEKRSSSNRGKTGEDTRAVTQAIGSILDRPNAPVLVKAVCVEQDFAVAAWIQHGSAGRALLMRTKGQWIVSACGDASLIEYGNLQRIGMSRAAAKKLAEKIRVAESALTEDEKRQISKFNGVLKLDDARETPRS
jgi:hypothetical protein